MPQSKLLNQVIELAQMMLEESPFSGFDSNDIPQLIETCEAEGTLITEEASGDVVGFLCWIPVSYHPILGECRLAAELAWYVHPDYRTSGAGKNMLARYERAVRERGFTHSMTSAMFNESFDKVKALYEKNGYKMVEASFIKEIN